MSSQTDQSEQRTSVGIVSALTERLEHREPYLLISPTVVWFLIFLIIPVLVIFMYSFLSYSNFNVVYEFTLESWTSTLLSDAVVDTFVRTIGIALFVTAITLVFAYPIAYFLRFYVGEIMGIILLLFLVIPFWTSELIRTLGWFPILGRNGLINWVLLGFGITDEPIRWLLFSLFSQTLGYLQNFLVFMAAPIYISLAQIDEDLLDASQTLRSGPISTFRRVTLPLSLPGVAIGCIFTFVLAIGNFTVPQFLSGGDRTITMLIYEEVSRGLNYPNASAMSVALLFVIFGFVYALLRVVDITDIAQG